MSDLNFKSYYNISMEKERRNILEGAIDNSYNLASVDKQFEYLKPTKDQLLMLRKKIKDIKEDYEQLLKTVERCELYCQVNFELQVEVRRHIKEVHTLQQTISDLHVYQYQEREQTLKLQIENDRLRLREAEDRRKINILLALCGINEPELTILLGAAAENTLEKLPTCLQKFKNTLQASWNKFPAMPQFERAKSKSEDRDALESQMLLNALREQKRNYEEQLQSLYQERDLSAKERVAEQVRLLQHNSRLSHKLKDTQTQICNITKELIKVKEEQSAKELSWEAMRQNLSENLECYQKELQSAQLLRPGYYYGRSEKSHSKKSVLRSEQPTELLSYKSSQYVSGTGLSSRTAKFSARDCTLDSLKDQLQQKEKLLAKYQEQILHLEEAKAKLQEQVSINKEKVTKAMGQITHLKNKYKELDTRRMLEAEGFQNDIKMLRKRLDDLQKCFQKNKKLGQLSQSETEEALREELQDALFRRDKAIKQLHQLQNRLDSMIREFQELSIIK